VYCSRQAAKAYQLLPLVAQHKGPDIWQPGRKQSQHNISLIRSALVGKASEQRNGEDTLRSVPIAASSNFSNLMQGHTWRQGCHAVGVRAGNRCVRPRVRQRQTSCRIPGHVYGVQSHRAHRLGRRLLLGCELRKGRQRQRGEQHPCDVRGASECSSRKRTLTCKSPTRSSYASVVAEGKQRRAESRRLHDR